MEEQNKANEDVKTPVTQPRGVKRYLSVVWEFLKIIIIAAIIVLPIRYFLFQPFIVKGESMIPNFQSGDYLIVDEFSYLIGNPHRGDVIVLKFPLDTTQRFIKRVIGLPGERVVIKQGKVSISKDGKDLQLDEMYLPKSLVTDGDVDVVLGLNNYFVMGDNRPYSYDSRRWGILPRQDIIGKAAIRLFPITSATIFTTPAYK